MYANKVKAFAEKSSLNYSANWRIENELAKTLDAISKPV
jgi:hypothetical protein